MHDGNETPDVTGQVYDAPQKNWVDLYAPARLRPFLRLSRMDRPIGTWLLLWPCWWGALLAALAGQGMTGEVYWIMAACAVGALLMRGAGCTWNDITDRDIDAKVARTRSRPLPSGQVSLRGAYLWMVLQALIAFGFLLTFNWLAVMLGIASLALVAIYPFAKRFTWWPQAFLGLAFNWGAILAYAAVAGEVSLPPLLLYGAGISWTLFYDTIYAHQDIEDDALIGVKSTARLFGADTHKWLTRFMAITVTLMGAAILFALLPGKDNILALVLALGGPWAMGWHLAWQNRTLDIEKPELCMQVFRSNRNTGLIPIALLAAALLV